MNFLCFDISSGGITAAIFDLNLHLIRSAETAWVLSTDDHGAATLPIDTIEAEFKRVIQLLKITGQEAIRAVCTGTFMHNCVLLDDTDHPLTPVFTWLDQRGSSGVEYIRSRIGDRFHERTGCRYHPMFPVFKLVSMRMEHTRRVVSVKAFLIHRLTGQWIEDHGIASASGLFNIRAGDWDEELMALTGLSHDRLPRISGRSVVMGSVTPDAAHEFGLPDGTPVVNGSGDGFLANIGSECETSSRLAVTLGTSAVVRQALTKPVLDHSAGTFCYKADDNSYLLGCAGSNGGNVLDWGRQIFGSLKESNAAVDPPIFIPLLHGERSPDWDPTLTGSWYGLTGRHSASDLSASVLEGVVFNLAHFVDIVQKTSGQPVSELVLSGNGFLHPTAAPMLAGIAGLPTCKASIPGIASLRGAGICCLRALDQPIPPLEMVDVSPSRNLGVIDRYHKYRTLRNAAV